MKVKELIKDTIWMPSKKYHHSAPKISVLLPTFCQTKSELLNKAIDSILAQTFNDFELIIVDDDSSDETQKIVQGYMQQDERISCLRHRHQIGLPYISKYEAFMKAKGEYIAFAFEDFIFEDNAFEVLYNAIHETEYKFCYGMVRIYDNSKLNYVTFGDNIEKIYYTNPISNSAIIIKKEIFDQVGLFDPHILLSRMADWDLWIRIQKECLVKYISNIIGSEYNRSTHDNSENSYFFDSGMAHIYTTASRNKRLLPENFQEFDFTENIHYLDSYSNFYIQESLKLYSSKYWYQQTILNLPKPKKIIAFYSSTLTNYYLAFLGLHSTNTNFQVKIIRATNQMTDIYQLLRADIVIFNRELHPYTKLLAVLNKLKVKCYYFLDDNFIVINEENPTLDFIKWYTPKNMKQTLSLMDGVLVPNKNLQKFFLDNKLHTSVFYHPPLIDEKLLERNFDFKFPENTELSIAIVGGEFRKDCVLEQIIPALNQIHKIRPVKLYIRKGLLTKIEDIHFEYYEISPQENYYQFIHHLRSLNIDILIHPAGKTGNLKYKTNSILLTALYINSAIIVTEEPAFQDTDLEQGVVKIKSNSAEFIEAITYLSQPATYSMLKEKLHNYCLNNFTSTPIIANFDKMTEEHHQDNFLKYERNLDTFITILSQKAQAYDKIQKNVFYPYIKGLFNFKTKVKSKASRIKGMLMSYLN